MQYIDEYEPETAPMTLEELEEVRPPESLSSPEAKYDLHYIWSQFLKTVQFEYEEPQEAEPDDDDDDSFFYEEHYDDPPTEEETEPETDLDEDEEPDTLPGWTKQEDGWVVKVGTKKIVNVAK